VYKNFLLGNSLNQQLNWDPNSGRHFTHTSCFSVQGLDSKALVCRKTVSAPGTLFGRLPSSGLEECTWDNGGLKVTGNTEAPVARNLYQ
jgi:hypothetical protein